MSKKYDDAWEELKQVHKNRCANCGAEEGKMHRLYDGIVKLQKGHQDPEKILNKANIIPQCQFCNSYYQSDFTFDEKGQVRAVANVGPVLRASKQVRNLVYEMLKEELGE